MNTRGWLLLTSMSLVTALAPQLARAERRPAVLEKDAVVYREARANSEALGFYRKGLKLKVFYPDRQGFYAIYYPTPVKGSHYGWIAKENLSLLPAETPADTPPAADAAPAASARKSTASDGRRHRNWIQIGLTYASYSPSQFQTTVGENATSLGQVGFEISGGHLFTPHIFGEARLEYYSFTVPLQNSPNPTNNFYFANGDLITFSAGYLFLDRPKFSLYGELGPGIGISQAGDVYGTNQTQSQFYISFPITFRVGGTYSFSERFALSGELAEQIHQIGTVNLVNATSTTLTSPLNLNALVLDLGLQFRF